MTEVYETQVAVDANPEQLLATVIRPEFYEARDRAQGAIAVEVEVRVDSETRRELVVHTTRHAHGLSGPKRNKTEASTTTLVWDLRRRAATWTFAGVHGERVAVEGTMRIEPSETGAVLHDRFEVSVRVPLLGGKAEQLVISEMKKGRARYEAVVREELAKVLAG